jgi:hypothetical protein
MSSSSTDEFVLRFDGADEPSALKVAFVRAKVNEGHAPLKLLCEGTFHSVIKRALSVCWRRRPTRGRDISDRLAYPLLVLLIPSTPRICLTTIRCADTTKDALQVHNIWINSASGKVFYLIRAPKIVAAKA